MGTTTKTTNKRSNNGLSKRCACARRAWGLCEHPWHFDFFKSPRKYRFSLDVLAKARGEDPPRTKHSAEALAAVVRSEIRTGRFRDPHAPVTPDPTAAVTFGDVADRYVARHVEVPGRRPAGKATMLHALAVLRRTEIPAAQGQTIRLEAKPFRDMSKADIEAIRDARRAQARPGSRGVGLNRLLARLRHLCGWAVDEGYRDDSPFVRGGRPVIKLTAETPRDRRLVDPAEEEALLAAAGPHLRDLILAGLATGCRVGELLGLQWRDVQTTTDARGQTHQTLVLQAGKTKTAQRREVTVGTRLAAVLAMRQHAPDGTRLGPEAFVFGNETGEQVQSIKKAWAVCVLKAHGHTPQWQTGRQNQLTAESRAAYRAINLHFHDLRREFGSRVLESGSSLVEARDLLGHSDISQTSTYLQSTARSLGLAIAKKEQYERDLADARARQQQTPPTETDETPDAPTWVQ